FDCGAAKKPVAKRDSVAAEVHQRAAAGALHIPEPIAVRAEVLFTLLDEVDLAEAALIGHFFGLNVFRREEELFRIGQQHAFALAGIDHLVCFGERYAKRLFANHVFPGVREIDGHLGMQVIRGRNRHHLDIGLLEHLFVILKHARDAILPGELLRIAGGRRCNGDDFRLLRHELKRCAVYVPFESRSDDSDLYFAAVCHSLMLKLRCYHRARGTTACFAPGSVSSIAGILGLVGGVTAPCRANTRTTATLLRGRTTATGPAVALAPPVTCSLSGCSEKVYSCYKQLLVCQRRE